jgi:ketosteroid isomerase-like protein
VIGLKYDMVDCWIVRFNQDGKIDQVRAYGDTDRLTRAIEENG